MELAVECVRVGEDWGGCLSLLELAAGRCEEGEFLPALQGRVVDAGDVGSAVRQADLDLLGGDVGERSGRRSDHVESQVGVEDARAVVPVLEVVAGGDSGGVGGDSVEGLQLRGAGGEDVLVPLCDIGRRGGLPLGHGLDDGVHVPPHLGFGRGIFLSDSDVPDETAIGPAEEEE